MDEAMAVHYRQKHSGDRANFKFELITAKCNTVLRKIYEAFYILFGNQIYEAFYILFGNQKLMISLELSYYIGF